MNGKQADRTWRKYNLQCCDRDDCNSSGMPHLMWQDTPFPASLVGFNHVLTASKVAPGAGVHFFIDDYQFERVWDKPESYVNMLSKYDFVLSPDFSLYTDMPLPMQRWNVYRSRALGKFWAKQGMTVIPTVSWSDEDSYSFAFAGLDEYSTVAVSTVGVRNNARALELWKQGMSELLNRIKPQRLLVYGFPIDFDYGSTAVRYYANDVITRLKGL